MVIPAFLVLVRGRLTSRSEVPATLDSCLNRGSSRRLLRSEILENPCLEQKYSWCHVGKFVSAGVFLRKYACRTGRPALW